MRLRKQLILKNLKYKVLYENRYNAYQLKKQCHTFLNAWQWIDKVHG